MLTQILFLSKNFSLNFISFFTLTILLFISSTNYLFAESISAGEGGVIESVDVATLNAATPAESIMDMQSTLLFSDLSPFTVVSVKGDYVANGVGLRGRTTGLITISDIPAGATVKQAYLYWSFLDNGLVDTERNLILNGTSVTGTEIESGDDTCWNRVYSRAFRADVTPLILGNGTFTVSGVPTVSPLLAQGAALVVIYELPTGTQHTVIMQDGNGVIGSYNYYLSTIIEGFTAYDTGNGIGAKTTYIVGDGQAFTDNLSFSGGNGTMALTNKFSGSSGRYWDTNTYDVSAYMQNGDTSVQATVSRGTDCLNWVGQVFSVTTQEANHIPMLSSPIEVEDDGVQDTKGVADKTNFVFSVTAQGNPDSVSLVVDGIPYPALRNGNTWKVTKTFPKGGYAWYFEATKDVTIEKTKMQQITTGYSNVAFLPGLEASRLYYQQTFENQLWEPNRNKDVEKLYLDATTGKSVFSGIYTRDIIGQANNVPGYHPNIYLNFIDFMDNEMVGNNIIEEWKALPYDWRFDYSQLLTSGKRVGGTAAVPYLSYEEATSTPYLLQELRRLTETSDTGKVTIITHSNGGLVAKYLLNELQKEDDSLLPKVDALIMVAAPQVGTPDAVEALLHGDGQQLSLWDTGFIMDEDRVRSLGENMPSAYNLLPTQKYFDVVKTPVITFDGNRFCGLTAVFTYGLCFTELYDRAGESITSYNEMKTFLLGDNGKRPKPDHDDEEAPNVLNPRLFPSTEATHDTIDSWSPPASMEVIQIAGWGKKTLRTIEYSCGKLTCSSISTLDRKIVHTIDGDGTVVVPSAVYMDNTFLRNTERYYVDLESYDTAFRVNRKHSDILEVKQLREFIQNIIQGNRNRNEKIIRDSKPLVENSSDRLDFTLHSPVALHLYDNKGNHTGLIKNIIPDSDFSAFEAQLPNSYYHEYGEVKYAGANTVEATIVHLSGEDLGTFTFEVSQTYGDDVVASTSWKNIPVSSSTKATLNIQTVQTSGNLQLDIEGDGIVDFSIASSSEVNPKVSLAVLEKVIQTLGFEKGVTQSIGEKLEAAKWSLQRGDKKSAKGQLNALLNYIEAQKRKKIRNDLAEKLTVIIVRIQNDIIE